MRHHLASNAVLERSDDLAARGVVFGVRGETEQHVERQANRIPFDLNVAFLHNVEETDLYLARQIWELIEGEDSTVRAGKHSVVDRELIGEHVTTACRANWIDVSNDVGNRHIRCCELLHESAVAIDPCDWRCLSALVEQISRVLRDRREWIVVHLTAGDDWNDVVEQRRQRAENA